MSGRPINPDRQNALALGLKTYTGTVHKRCGTDQRYVSGGGCVHCARIIATEQREARVFVKKMQEQNVEGRDDDLLDSPVEDGLDADIDSRRDEEEVDPFEQSIEDLM